MLITKSVYCIKCDCYMYMYVHWCAEQVGVDQITGQIPKWLLGEFHVIIWKASYVIIFFSNNHLTDNAPHLQNCSPCLQRAQCYCLCSADSSQAFSFSCSYVLQLFNNYKLLFFVKTNLINIEADKFKTIEIRLQLIFSASDRMWWCRFT